MTIQELYDWAKENEVLDCKLVKFDNYFNDYTECNFIPFTIIDEDKKFVSLVEENNYD